MVLSECFNLLNCSFNLIKQVTFENIFKLINDISTNQKSPCNIIFRMCCYHHTAIWFHYITWISSTLSQWKRLYLEYSTANGTIDSIQFYTFWCRIFWKLHVSYSASNVLSYLKNGWFRSHYYILLISGIMIHWQFMLVVQIDQPSC